MNVFEGMTKSEQAIAGAYVHLLRTKHYSKVRVKDVLEVSGVVRSTFYKYFDDAFALLDRIERILLDRLSLYKSSSKSAREKYAGMPFESMQNWFEACIALRGVIAPVMGENGDPYFFKRLQSQMRRELNAMMNDDGVPLDEKRPYYVELCTAAYMGMLSYLITVSNEDDLLPARELALMANSTRAAWFTLDQRSPSISDERLFGAPDA